MKVKLRTIRCGPNGNYNVGDVIDVPAHEAEHLINTQQAVPWLDPRETATLATAERASLDRGAQRKIAGKRKAVEDGTEAHE